MRRALQILILQGALVLSAGVAHAQDADPEKLKEAAGHFDKGMDAFGKSQFKRAAGHFEAADRAAPSPNAISNAMRARLEAGQIAIAATLAANALRRYPNDKKVKGIAEPILRDYEAKLHKLAVSCSPGCSLAVDGKLTAGGTRLDNHKLFLKPGKHKIIAGWTEGRTRSSSVEASRGGEDTLSFKAPKPKKKPVAPVVGPEKKEPGKEPRDDVEPAPLPPWVFYTAAAGTVVMGGVALWSGIDTQNNPGADAVRTECAGGDATCPLYQEGLSKERRTNTLFAVTGTLAVATGIIGLFFTNWDGDKEAGKSASTRITPGINARGDVSIGISGLFLD